jgi:hypothetical protein
LPFSVFGFSLSDFLLASPPFPDDDDELACESCVSASVSSGASISAADRCFSVVSFVVVVDSSVLFNLDKIFQKRLFLGFI